MSWTPGFVRRRPAAWAILVFCLIALPGGVDAWLSLWDKYSEYRQGPARAMTFSLGDWWYPASVLVGFMMLVYILVVVWRDRRRRATPENPAIEAERQHYAEARRTVVLAVVDGYNRLVVGEQDAGERLHSAALIAWKHWLTPDEKEPKSVIHRAWSVIATAHHDSDFTITPRLTEAIRDFTEVWPPARTLILPPPHEEPPPQEEQPASEWLVQNLRRIIKVYSEAETDLVKLARNVTRQAAKTNGDPHKLLSELIESDAIQGGEPGRTHYINALDRFKSRHNPTDFEAQEARQMLHAGLGRIRWIGACLWRATSLVSPTYLVSEQYVSVYQQLDRLVKLLEDLDGTDLGDLAEYRSSIRAVLREPRPPIPLSDPRRNQYKNGAGGGEDQTTVRVTLGSGKALKTRSETISGEAVVEVDLHLVLEHPQPFLEGEEVRLLVAELEEGEI